MSLAWDRGFVFGPKLHNARCVADLQQPLHVHKSIRKKAKGNPSFFLSVQLSA